VVSHLPHLVASALAAVAAGDPLALSLAAGSFRDGTRVAATRAELTAAMCGGNAVAVRTALAGVHRLLDEADHALAAGDPIAALKGWLEPGVRARTGWPPAASDAVELPTQPEVLLRLGRAGGWVTAVSPDRRTVTAVRPL
jgi:prephenate dehydrogenase